MKVYWKAEEWLVHKSDMVERGRLSPFCKKPTIGEEHTSEQNFPYQTRYVGKSEEAF